MCKRMKKIHCIYQSIPNECAACCVSMILNYYNYNIKHTFVRKELGIGRSGVKLSNIKIFFVKQKFNVKVYEANLNGIHTLGFPLLATWSNNHYVVLEKILNGNIYIIDPNCGRLILNAEEFNNDFGGYVLFAAPIEPIKPKNNISFNKIFKYANIKNYTRNIILLFIISIFCYFLILLNAFIIQLIIDRFLVNGRISIYVLVGIVIFTISYIILYLLKGSKNIVLGSKIYRDLAKKIIQKILNIPYAFLQLFMAGDLVHRLNAISLVNDLYFNYLLDIIFDVGAVGIITIYMLYKLYELYIYVFIFSVVLIICLINVIIKINDYNFRVVFEDNKLNAISSEMIYTIQDMKVNNLTNRIHKKWLKQFERLNSWKVKYSKLQNMYMTIANTGNTIFPILMLFLSINYSEYIGLTIGECLAFYSITIIYYSLITSIALNLNEILSALRHLEKIDDILEADNEPDGTISLSKNESWDLRISNLSFKYNKYDNYIIDNVNLYIPYGQMVAFVGSSGSGKSTLAKLILRLYEPSEGTILLGKYHVEDIRKSEYYKNISLVSQELNLYNASFYENIVTNSEIEFEKIRDICKMIQLDKEIMEMPMKYNTIIGDLGKNISGGQRQRVALARALVKNPKILVLDEATSFLDNLAESKITEYLNRCGCTRIIFAHRLSTIINADRIYVMSNGSIVESGNHQDLIKNQGYYYKLYSSQNQIK